MFQFDSPLSIIQSYLAMNRTNSHVFDKFPFNLHLIFTKIEIFQSNFVILDFCFILIEFYDLFHLWILSYRTLNVINHFEYLILIFHNNIYFVINILSYTRN